MKNIFIFLLLILIINCIPYSTNEEKEKDKRRKEAQNKMVDCILKSQNGSNELKKQVEENKGNDLRRFFHHLIEKLEKNDQDVIRKCRREIVYNKYQFLPRNYRRTIPESLKSQYIKQFIKNQ